MDQSEVYLLIKLTVTGEKPAGKYIRTFWNLHFNSFGCKTAVFLCLRLVNFLRDNEDVNEESDQRSDDPVRTSEMQSDRSKMQEKLLNFQKARKKSSGVHNIK